MGQKIKEESTMANINTGQIRYINPKTMYHNPAYTQVVTVTGPVTTVYIGGQDAVDASGNIVGKGDIGKQTEQVLRNVQSGLEAANAGPEHVIKWNIYIVEGQPLEKGFEAFQKWWGQRPNPPVITASFVSSLANHEYLVEIEAVAIIPN
jgi:enamine deaminase RidA (YjgF/YER057c/UK114 family)